MRKKDKKKHVCEKINALFSKDPNICFPEEVEKHIKIMLRALLKVDKDYLWYSSHDIRNEKDYNDDPIYGVSKEETKKIEHLERVFAYEFYHQWRTILQSLKTGLYLNGEITKIIVGKMEEDKKEKKDKSRLFPDLVLHGGQGDLNPDKQFIACEIKRREGFSKDKFIEDIISLMYYLKNLVPPYQCGVFILIGGQKGLEEDCIKKAISENSEIISNKELYSKILCVSFNYDYEHKQALEIKTLKTIMENNNAYCGA